MDAQFRMIVSGEDTRVVARLARPVLSAVAGPYRWAVAARNCLYDASLWRTHRVDVPVVSIGNLTLGGTGKTPFVEFVCRWFLDHGKRPVILSRGYRRVAGVESSSPQPALHDARPVWGLEDSTPATQTLGLNDEALLLQANLPDVPHLQGKDRVALARQAIEQFHPDVLVLDDGFQHRRLARDPDIVLIDCTEPFGYGAMFPRGLLREPVSSLKRADLIVLSRASQCSDSAREQIRDQILAAAGKKPIVLAEHHPKTLRTNTGEVVPVAALAGRTVVAFCGIGNPQAFWETLRRLGCQFVATLAFRDHNAYAASDLQILETRIQAAQPDFVVTTQKDLVKLDSAQLGQRPLLALQIEAAVTDPERVLDEALGRVLAAAASVPRAA